MHCGSCIQDWTKTVVNKIRSLIISAVTKSPQTHPNKLFFKSIRNLNVHSFQTVQPWLFQTIWTIFYEQFSIKVKRLKEALQKVKLEGHQKKNFRTVRNN